MPNNFLDELRIKLAAPVEITEPNNEEICLRVKEEYLRKVCGFLHKRLHSPVMACFAVDKRKESSQFDIHCVFLGAEIKKWVTVINAIPADIAKFSSLSKEIYSVSLFEREIYEMFGILPEGNPDLRRLHLHDEVWPKGAFPLRKDFELLSYPQGEFSDYVFNHIEGEGIFEVPVGPVHAGIIGPGHFRFSVAGEPIVNLELRLGFTHRGIEKIFEGKDVYAAVNLSERVSGDSAFSHSWAFCRAIEKITKADVPAVCIYERAICLELERIYNHFTGIGGMAVDVGFSYPAQFAAVLKERVLRLNAKLTQSRYLKGFNYLGGVRAYFREENLQFMRQELSAIIKEHSELKKMLYGSVSFMDRADDTGVLRKKTAEDIGIIGLAGRASGINLDLRKVFPDVYKDSGFHPVKQERGDCLSRLKVRIDEVEESIRLINYFSDKIKPFKAAAKIDISKYNGSALGAIEGWRGPVLYWVEISNGVIDRCKVVDASFHNWQGLSFAVLGNIIPDFPLCNKSFDLSYAGNDL